MKSPCELITKYVLPVFRAMVAKQLMEIYGFSQNQVASKLGITQAAVSQYINSKRGAKMVEELMQVPGVRKTLNDVTKTLATSDDTDEMVLAFCRLCSVIKSSDTFWNNFETVKKIGSPAR